MNPVHVAGAARQARAIVDEEQSVSEDLWRFGILQLLDDYNSTLKFAGVSAAAHIFDVEPDRTGDSGLDAAFAALACWLATRDGWQHPTWAQDPTRVARPWWFVSESEYGKAWALVQSPGEFRIRGVFITSTTLDRV